MINNKKILPFRILEILKDYSDYDNQLKQKDIIDKLYNIYDLEIDRKTITPTIDMLNDLGYSIEKGDNGYYLSDRLFDEEEIRYLIDAIFSSKNIPINHSKDLLDKLKDILPIYKRNNYGYIYKANEIQKTNNKEFFYNISIINEAISNNKKIEFKYLTYDIKGTLIEKNNGYVYKVSPYYLINNNGNYYLLGNLEIHSNSSVYRLDYIKDIKILDEYKKDYSLVTDMGKNFDIAKYLNNHIYLYNTKIIHAKIEIKDHNSVQYVYDYFNNPRIQYTNNKLYAYIESSEESLLYWDLQFSEHFTLIEPLDLRNRLKEMLEKSIKEYK